MRATAECTFKSSLKCWWPDDFQWVLTLQIVSGMGGKRKGIKDQTSTS